MSRYVVLLLAAASVYSQQQPNTVTATASVTRPSAAASAVFDVQFLDASLSSTVDSAVSATGAAGTSASNLTASTVSLTQGFVVSSYTFRITVPAGEFAAQRDKLIALQRALANVQTQAVSWSLAYIPGEENAAVLLKDAMPSLLARTKQQAEILAEGMGKALGTPVALSSPAVVNTGLQVQISLTATYSVQ